MAMTTTAINGCNAVIKLDDDAGLPIDISGSSNEIEFDLSQEIGTFKTFGSAWHGRIACGKDGTISMQVVYSTAVDEASDLIFDWFFSADSDVPRTLTVDLPDSSIGGDRYTAEVLIENLQWTGGTDDGDALMISVDFVPAGTIGRAAIAA